MFFNKSYRYNQFSKLMEKELYSPACAIILMDIKKTIFDNKVRKRVHDFIRSNFPDKVESCILNALQATARDTVSFADLQLLLKGSNNIFNNLYLVHQIDTLSIENLSHSWSNVRQSSNLLYEEDVYRIANRVYDYAHTNLNVALRFLHSYFNVSKEIRFDMSSFPEKQLIIARLAALRELNKDNNIYGSRSGNSEPLEWDLEKCSSKIFEVYGLHRSSLQYIRIIGEEKMMPAAIDYIDKMHTNPLFAEKHYNEIVLACLQHGLNRIASYIMKRRDIKAVTKLCKDLIVSWNPQHTLKEPQSVLFAVAAKDLTPAARESLFESMQNMSKEIDNFSEATSIINFNEILHKIHWIETINKMLDEKRPEKIKVAKPRASRKKLA